ncbi:MAG: hypothetical protein ACQETL_17710 [Bacteroidota bacterium]
MNNSIYFILILLAGISCSEPEKKKDLSEIHKSLIEQKQFYYNVEYSIINSLDQSTSKLFGTVSLNRNTDSGISSGYFGLAKNQLPNYLHSMYLKNDWIHDLSSNLFDLQDADVLSDSLHSPILINPNLLFEIESNSRKITKQKSENENVKWIFHLAEKAEQLVLVWNEEHKKVIELEYRYDLDYDHSYSRKWSYDYLSKSEFNVLTMVYKHQNQTAEQPFL